MDSLIDAKSLVVPVYINEKIVLDMLATIEDGFSMVSQVNYTEQKESNSSQGAQVGISTSSTILSKLLKINISGRVNHDGKKGEEENISTEKVHTNVSLFSKFREYLLHHNILKSSFDISNMKVGDFVEIEGDLQKNPLINYMDIMMDIFRMAEIFSEEPQLGNKTQAKAKKEQDNKILKQVQSFNEELKHTGTVDFILSDKQGKAVLSVQEQYLSNDNISEIVGGRFKVLGKVIYVCKEETEEINLLRKTSLSILSEELISEIFASLKSDDMKQFNLPELITKINGPAVIIIPVAIYA